MASSDLITYVCTKCGAEDHARKDEQILALTCHKCGAGRNVPIPDMIQRGVGMFPKREAVARG